jgi:hypothetical protein
MIEISESIAETVGRLRGSYPFLKTVDAIPLVAALDLGTEAFVTNDGRLGKLNDLRGLALKDYL